jgi:hypothetical protein
MRRPYCDKSFLATLFFLIAVPLWLWLHLIFWPTDLSAQKYDLYGTWVRVICAITFGSCAGMIVGRRPILILWIWAAQLTFVIVTAAYYVFDMVYYKEIIIANFKSFFKYKSALVYFLIWPCLLLYGILNFIFIKKDMKYNNKILTMVILLLILCWLEFVLPQALNGAIIASLSALVLFFICLLRVNNNLYKYLFLLVIASILLLGYFSFSAIDKKYSGKLYYLLDDVSLSADIYKHNAWRGDPRIQEPTYPVDPHGRTVAGSTYLRTSWFLKGIELLQENPLGSGFSHLAFRYYMQKEDASLDLHKTHSGWLDYALGVGVPGILFSWLAIGLLIATCLKRLSYAEDGRKMILIAIIWQLIGMWFLWWPTEISEREFIENFFFNLAFFAGVISQFERNISSNKQYFWR